MANLILSQLVFKRGVLVESLVGWFRRWYLTCDRGTTEYYHVSTHWFVVMEMLKPIVELLYAFLQVGVEH